MPLCRKYVVGFSVQLTFIGFPAISHMQCSGYIASQRDAQITHAIILTDSVNLLQKVESGMGSPDWHTAMHSLRLQRLLYGSTVLGTPESVGMNGQIDWQAQQISHLICSLAGQRCSGAWGTFWTWTGQSITALIAWRKEEWRKEAADIRSTIQDREGAVFNQTNIGTVSKATFGRLLRDGAERVWAFPSATMPSWAETET